jgi:OmpA-OmpF porin, OOP family
MGIYDRRAESQPAAIGLFRRMAAAALACLALTPALAFAQADVPAAATHESSTYIATGLFYQSPDSSRLTDYGAGINYGYGAHFGDKRALELRLFADTQETGIAGATDFYQVGAGLDLLQYFGKPSGGHPYVLIAAGVIGNDVVPDDQDGASFYAAGGIGWRSAPWKKWQLRHRIDLRGVYDTFDGSKTDFILGFTLEIPQERERIVVHEKIVEKIVEKEVIKEVIREVPVPAPAPVAAADVDIDRDDDGIPDDKDKCPDTVGGAKVEADGCVHKEQVVVLPNIEFEFASAVLTAKGRENLDGVVKFMKDQTDIPLDVWGHTDQQGDERYNQRLSEKRAASVKQHLVDNGIAAERMTSAGFGESKPLDPNKNLAAYRKNRRVELHIRAVKGAGG